MNLFQHFLSRHYNHAGCAKAKILAVLFFTLFLFGQARGQTNGDYRTRENVSGNWNGSATWQTYNNGWADTSTPPTSANGVITIRGGATVTVTAAVTVDQVVVEEGGTVNLTSNVTLTIANGAGTDFLISGTLYRTTGTITTTGTLVFGDGGTYQHAQDGGTIPTATWNANSTCLVTGITSTMATGLNQTFGHFTWNCSGHTGNLYLASNMTVNGNFTVLNTGNADNVNRSLRMSNNTSGYTLNVGGDFNINSPATFKMNNAGSACILNITGNLNIDGQAAGTTGFYLNTSNSSGSSATVNLTGNLNVSSGNLIFSDDGGSYPAILNLRGNFNQTGGVISSTQTTAGYIGTLNFAGTNPQTFTKTSGTIASIINFTINNGATVDFGTSVLDGSTGTFVINAGGTLITANTEGIAGSGNSGSIQVTGTRTFTAGANYIFNGTSNQVTGNGLTQNQPANVTINNPGNTVTLTASRTISGNLSILAGTFDLSTFTMNRSASGGTLTISNGATLRIGGTNPAPTLFSTRSFAANSTVEYYGTTQNISTETFGNLLISSGTKSTTGTVTINGDFTLSNGATVNTGNSWNPAGNWTVDGSFNQTGGTTTFSTGVTHSISGNGYSQFNILVTSSSTINGGSHDIRIAGNWTHGTAGTFNAQNSTVTFNGSGNQTQPPVGFVPSLYNLVINKSGGTMSTRVWTVANNFELLNGTLTLSNNSGFNNVKLAAGTLSAPAGTFTVSGNWENNNASAFVAGTGTVTFNGTNAQIIGGTANTTFNNLTVNNTNATVTLNGTQNIGGNFSIGTGSQVNLSTSTHTTGTLTLGGIGKGKGLWGSTVSVATFTDDTFFTSTTGMVNAAGSICPAITASISGTNVICDGSAADLTITISGGTGPYSVQYTGGTLNSFISATPVTVTPSATTTYVLTSVTDINGCDATLSGFATISVNPAPIVTAQADNLQICADSPVLLTASVSGPLTPPATLLDEGFNEPTNNWLNINNSTGTGAEDAAWTLRPAGYFSIQTNDNSQFYITDSNASGTATVSTILQSPAMNTIGYSTLTLTFYQYFNKYSNGSETAKVDISVNGTSWSNIATYSTNQGTYNNFALVTINLNAYTGNQTIYLRFKYDAQNDYWWAIDNVKVTGTPSANYTYHYSWEANPAGNAGLPEGAGVPSATNASVTAYPSQNIAYTATAINTTTGCTGSALPVELTVNPLPAFTIGSFSNISCFGASDGSITINATGGSAPYSYSIKDGIWQDENTFTGLPADTYTPKVKDSKNCIQTICE